MISFGTVIIPLYSYPESKPENVDMNKPFSIIHLSDLHFGRIQPDILEHLDDFLIKRKNEIDLGILTGDLTQRARRSEFRAAREFLDSLHHPLFVVPGNHDVPLYTVFLRWLYPYRKFLTHIGPTENYFEDDKVAVFGLWTVDNFAIHTGKLRRSDLLSIEERFRQVPEHKIKIIACHHPLLSIKRPRIKNDIKRIIELKPHFILWGHEHQSSITHMKENEIFPIILSSGTTTSSRLRNEANSFNYIRFRENAFDIEIYRHSKILGAFELIDKREFEQREEDKSPPLLI